MFISESRARTIVAFDPDQWSSWFKNDPKLKNMELRPQTQLVPNSQKFLQAGGDVFFLIRSDVESDVNDILTFLERKMGKFFQPLDVTSSSPPNTVA